ncbi:MAG: rhodanese-like domain-containing protein [Lutimonas sp.]
MATVFLNLFAFINLNAQETQTDLPAQKQTTLGLYVTSAQAYAMWQASQANIKILDVRTPEEYMFVGHAPMAFNVPLALQTYQWNPKTNEFDMQPVADFVAQVKKVAQPTDTILVTCRSGGRSAMAVNQLAKAGYKYAYNITDGFEGDIVNDPESVFFGKRMVNGWKNSGLPFTYRIDSTRVILLKEN